jgi:hypothetical protein
LIVNRALNHTQITWGDLIEPDRPLQIEQPEVHHEIPPQGIEAAQTEGDNAQIEIPVPQPEMEADLIQLEETQSMQAGTSKKKRQRTIYVPETSTVKRRKGKKTTQPESTQETVQTEQPSHETPAEQQDDFFRSYEEEMAQVLGNLGISLTEDTDRSGEPQAPTSSHSNPVFDLPDMEMPSPEGTEQPEPQFDENNPLEQPEHPEDTGNQLPVDQGGEDLEIPHRQKETTGKGNNKIRKLEHENKTLRKRVKKIKVLKQKVGRLKETIRQLRKQLEQADKAHEKKKSKRARVQGRNPLPRRTVHTNSVGTQTKLHAPLETVEIETQTEAPTTIETIVQTEEVFHSPEQDAIIKRLEAELEQSQQTLTQCRSEMVTVSEHQKVVRQLEPCQQLRMRPLLSSTKLKKR